MQRITTFTTALLVALITTAGGAEPPATFKTIEIDPAACEKACYGVVLADVNGDKQDDIVVVTETKVQWYENPSWDKHVILDGQTEPDNVCIAPHDIDGDGQIDFALGAGWTKVGTIQWITRRDDPDALWQVHAIGQIPWTHRMRFADVLGNGQPQLTVSPLNATEENDGVELSAYEIPADPKQDAWPRTVINDSLNRVHNHWHIGPLPNGMTSTITASQEGLFYLALAPQQPETKVKLSDGAESDKANERGAGEVKRGQLPIKQDFLAAIEPMHGNRVVAYGPPKSGQRGDSPERHVIDDTLNQGHALWCADLDGDGDDEIIAGHREPGEGPIKGPGVYIYESDNDLGTKWTKHVLDDGGVATEDLICGDLTGDGHVDIVAVGRATKNVMLYVNQGAGEHEASAP